MARSYFAATRLVNSLRRIPNKFHESHVIGHGNDGSHSLVLATCLTGHKAGYRFPNRCSDLTISLFVSRFPHPFGARFPDSSGSVAAPRSITRFAVVWDPTLSVARSPPRRRRGLASMSSYFSTEVRTESQFSGQGGEGSAGEGNRCANRLSKLLMAEPTNGWVNRSANGRPKGVPAR